MRRMQSTGLVNRKRTLNAIKQIDAFPKVPESYQQTTASGGGSKFPSNLRNRHDFFLVIVDAVMQCYNRLQINLKYCKV